MLLLKMTLAPLSRRQVPSVAGDHQKIGVDDMHAGTGPA
jgi:hypothetical protein